MTNEKEDTIVHSTVNTRQSNGSPLTTHMTHTCIALSPKDSQSTQSRTTTHKTPKEIDARHAHAQLHACMQALPTEPLPLLHGMSPLLTQLTDLRSRVSFPCICLLTFSLPKMYMAGTIVRAFKTPGKMRIMYMSTLAGHPA